MEIQMIVALGDSVMLEALLDRTMCHAIRYYVFIINDCIENLLTFSSIYCLSFYIQDVSTRFTKPELLFY